MIMSQVPSLPASRSTAQPSPACEPSAGSVSGLRSVHLDAGGRVAWHLSRPEIAGALGSAERGEGVLWVDVNSAARDAPSASHDLLAAQFGFHPLAIEDAESPGTRVKLEEYDNRYLLVVLRAVRFRAETEDPYDVETSNLALFVGRGFLVTVHAEPSSSVDAVLDLVRRSPDLLSRGAARLAHMVADHAVDQFFPILDQIDDFVNGLEERVFERFDQSSLQEIFRVKRLVVTLRRYLAPQRDVLNALSNRPTQLVPPSDQVYFRDVYDHVLRINDSLDVYRDLLGGTLDSYLMQLSNRLGHVTKALSVVATVSIPFVVVSGMWGMNVGGIPLGSSSYGFVVMLVAQVVLAGALAALLRWRRLL